VTTGTHIPVDWLPDGSGLVFVDFGTAPLTPVGSSELAIVNVAGPARTKTLLEVPGRQGQARISPDGRWLAYESDETGEQNMGVFVRRFPDVNAGRWQISSGAGGKPLWSHDGRRLFYVSGQTLMSVAIRGETPVEWGTGEKLFGGEYLFSSPGQTLDAAPDGRFLVIKEDSGAPRVPDSLIVVQNWFEELKRLVPTN
jgi:serine/threonine-protein kinase